VTQKRPSVLDNLELIKAWNISTYTTIARQKNTFGLRLIFYQPAQSYCLVQAGKAFSNFAFLKRGFGSVFDPSKALCRLLVHPNV
jgi:hypothetical protein